MSGVLAAMRIGIERVLGAVRLSIGIFTMEDEVPRGMQMVRVLAGK